LDDGRFRGRRLHDLEVTEVAWDDRAIGHIGSRTTRYPDDPDEVDVVAEWATEAATDPYAAYSLTRSADFRVTGWSPNAPPRPGPGARDASCG